MRLYPVGALVVIGLAGLLIACRSAGEPEPLTARADPSVGAVAETIAKSETDPTPAPEPAPAPRTVFIAPGATSGLVQFAEGIPLGAKVWVGPMEGNGGRDVLIYAPPTDGPPKAELRLVYHFHGTYAERVQPKEEGMEKRQWVGWDRVQQTVDAATQLQTERPYDVALVYPLSAGKRLEPQAKRSARNKAYDRMWMLPDPGHGFVDSFDRMHEEVLTQLRALELDPERVQHPVMAEGHSAGGIALRNIASSGSTLVGDYLFLDASFQGWADGCHAALAGSEKTKSGAQARLTLVTTNDGIADAYGRRDPWCEKMPIDADAWKTHRAWCKGRAEEKPVGSDKSCEQLEEAAELWPKSAAWCADYRNDLKGTAGVTLVRTKVYHGDQPRHFAGGLELAPELGVGR